MPYTNTTIVDGAVNLIIHVYFSSDAAELTDEVLIDPRVDLTPPCRRLLLEKITYNFVGCSGRLMFDSGAPDETFAWVLPESSSNSVNFKAFGGFPDYSGQDGTGKVLFSTTGLAGNSTAEGSMILKFRKKGL